MHKQQPIRRKQCTTSNQFGVNNQPGGQGVLWIACELFLIDVTELGRESNSIEQLSYGKVAIATCRQTRQAVIPIMFGKKKLSSKSSPDPRLPPKTNHKLVPFSTDLRIPIFGCG
jgi:hypothetical protein